MQQNGRLLLVLSLLTSFHVALFVLSVGSAALLPTQVPLMSAMEAKYSGVDPLTGKLNLEEVNYLQAILSKLATDGKPTTALHVLVYVPLWCAWVLLLPVYYLSWRLYMVPTKAVDWHWRERFLRVAFMFFYMGILVVQSLTYLQLMATTVTYSFFNAKPLPVLWHQLLLTTESLLVVLSIVYLVIR